MLSRLLGTRGGWWLLASVLALSGATVAALLAGGELAGALAGGFTALTVLGFAWALQLRAQLGTTEEQLKQATGLAEARDAEMRHLAGARLPAISARVRAGQRLDGVPGPLTSPAATGEEYDRALNTVVSALGSDVAVRRERALRDSVQAAFESVARNMHAMATVQLRVLDNVEKIIDDPHLMSEVMRADHAAAQMTRKAQTLLVMCGIWPAKRESRPISLYDCVRGAQSRIVEFGRVEVHGGQTLHAVPPAVEGLMHSIAELLENATVFSPSNTQVVVTMREVGAGAVIEIDDAGLGMPPDTMHQALGQLRDDVDLAQLGAVPRLGLACVGRWARELGINVELTGASAYGGTRVVVFVPHRLLTEPLTEPPHREAMPREASQRAQGASQSAPDAQGNTSHAAYQGAVRQSTHDSPYGERSPHPAEVPQPLPGSASQPGPARGAADESPESATRPHRGPRHAAPPTSGAPDWSMPGTAPGDVRETEVRSPAPDRAEHTEPTEHTARTAAEDAPAATPNLPVRQRAQRSAPLPPPAGEPLPARERPGRPARPTQTEPPEAQSVTTPSWRTQPAPAQPTAPAQPAPGTSPAVAEPPARETGQSSTGLPKRRSRRKPPGGHGQHPLAPGQPAGLSQPFEAFGPNRLPPPEQAPWTPEAARASVASVLSGTRRGRAELSESPDPEPSEPPPRTSPRPSPNSSHDPNGDRP